MTPSETGVEIDELASLDETSGAPPKNRLQSVRAAHNLYLRLKRDDEEASRNRARIQAMFDGAPPYKSAEMAVSGRKSFCNLNFGEADRSFDDALTSYVDLLNEETLVRGKIRMPGIDPSQKLEWEAIIFDEISRAIRQWPGFMPNTLQNATYFIQHGLSFCYFPDGHDWRWQVTRMGEFLVPRRTRSSVDAIEIAFARKEFRAHEIYNHIRNETAAKAAGWNIAEARKTILDTHRGNTSASILGEWERYQEEVKELDLWSSEDRGPIDLIHCWVKEFDGTVSHYLFREDNQCEKFLFAKPRRFGAMEEAFVAFVFGVGSTGNFASVRGLGYKIYPHIQVSNRTRCDMIDGAKMASTALFRPINDESLDTMKLAYMGPIGILSPGLEYVDMTPPNLSNSVIPVLGEMDRLLRDRTAGYSPHNSLPNKGEMTRYETQSRLHSAASLSSTSQTLYYLPNDHLLTQVIRRMIRPTYQKEEPGGREVQMLRARLEERGVPKEAFFAIDLASVETTRAIGGGSQAARDAVYEELTSLSPSFDPVGRARLIRDRVANRVGFQAADRYAPAPEETRVSLDAKIAELENNDLMDGKQIQVRPNDLHFDHLPVHAALVEQLIAAVDQGAPLEEVTPLMVPIHAHAVGHLEMVTGDVLAQGKVAAFRERLQQAGEIIINGTRRLQSLARKQGAGPRPRGQEGRGPGDDAATVEARKDFELNDRLERQVQEHQLKLANIQREHDLKLELRAREADLERRLKDAKAAAEIARKGMAG